METISPESAYNEYRKHDRRRNDDNADGERNSWNQNCKNDMSIMVSSASEHDSISNSSVSINISNSAYQQGI